MLNIKNQKILKMFKQSIFFDYKNNERLTELKILEICKLAKRLCNTNFKRSIYQKLEKDDAVLLLLIPGSEYSWVLGENFTINLKHIMTYSDKHIINESEFYNNLYTEKFQFDENNYILKRDNSNSNSSPDFILWEISTGIEIGIEITSISILNPMRSFTDGRDENRKDEPLTTNEANKLIQKITSYTNKFKEEFDVTEKSINITNKKIKLLQNWKTNRNFLIIQLPYDWTKISSRFQKIYLSLEMMIMGFDFNTNSNFKKFQSIMFSSSDFGFQHIKKSSNITKSILNLN